MANTIIETATTPTPTLEEALRYFETTRGDFSGGLAEHQYATPEEIQAYYRLITDYLCTDRGTENKLTKQEGTLGHLINIQMTIFDRLIHPLQIVEKVMELVNDLGTFDCRLDDLTGPNNLN